MDTRFWISGLVMSVLALALGFVVHGVLLGNDYAKLVGLFRQPAEAHGYFHYMLLAHVLFGFAITWIYRQGRTADSSAIAQGIRFGIAIALLMTIPIYLIYYAVQPMPGATVAKQILFDSVAMVLMGVAVALLNPAPAASNPP